MRRRTERLEASAAAAGGRAARRLAAERADSRAAGFVAEGLEPLHRSKWFPRSELLPRITWSHCLHLARSKPTTSYSLYTGLLPRQQERAILTR